MILIICNINLSEGSKKFGSHLSHVPELRQLVGPEQDVFLHCTIFSDFKVLIILIMRKQSVPPREEQIINQVSVLTEHSASVY